MATVSCPVRSLSRQWRRQVLSRLNPWHLDARRGFVAMTFVDLAKTSSVMVDIERLLVNLLYEDRECGEPRL